MKKKKNSILRSIAAAPHVFWAIMFIVLPLIIVMYYAFTDAEGSFSFENIAALPDYAPIFLLSLELSIIATFVCLLVGYPLAYFIAKAKPHRQKLYIMLMMLPMWTNLLIRTYSIMAIFDDGGFLNTLLGTSMHIIGTKGAVIFGMVYDFLPFMIYPIYNTLQKMDNSLIEAAHDLGATRRQVFMKVILPLSAPGIYSGIVMVFMPTVSTFAIAELLTHNKVTLFGSLIQRCFGEGGIAMWNYGAALSLIMLIIIGMTSFFGDDREDINR
mgnify:CR=1 FL=1